MRREPKIWNTAYSDSSKSIDKYSLKKAQLELSANADITNNVQLNKI